MTPRRWVLLALLTLATASLGVPAASAAPAPHAPLSLQDVKTGSGRLAAVVDGVDFPRDRVALRINGRSVPVTSTPVVGRPRTAVLVVDTSGSMLGSRMSETKKAIGAYLAAVPRDVSVGLVTFANRAKLVVAPTTVRAKVSDALTRIRPGGGTAIYDALDVAMSVAPRGQLVVLTDGTDTVSKHRLPETLTRVRNSQVTIDVVGLQNRSESKATAVQAGISAAGRGHAYSVGVAAKAADRMHQLRLSAHLPANLTGAALISVTATGPTGHANTTTTVAAPGSAPASTSSLWLFAGLGAAFISLLLLVFLIIDLPRDSKGRRRMRELVGLYTGRAGRARKKDERARFRESPIAQTALELADRVTAGRGLGERLTRKLQTARVSLEPNEWLLTCLGVAVGSGLLTAVLLHNPLIGLVVGLVAGILGPHTFLSIKARRRQAAFSNDLPDALQLMAGGLSSGYSLPQAVDSVVRLGEGPIAEEFGRALAQARLGTSVEDALDEVADRVDNVDFRWVVMAIRIQRQVGGNLSELLVQVAETIRERAWLRRHVAGLAAEGKLSAYILGGLPVVVGGYMFLVRRDYIRPLYTQTAGIVMLAGAILLLVTGALFMRKLVKVEL